GEALPYEGVLTPIIREKGGRLVTNNRQFKSGCAASSAESPRFGHLTRAISKITDNTRRMLAEKEFETAIDVPPKF
ncbi:MAG TPA: hypothetical protein VKP30_04690, partial [Polyangiaceae bacterium]|nr:hypothetical protein [Polyangiaceae bacterium]